MVIAKLCNALLEFRQTTVQKFVALYRTDYQYNLVLFCLSLKCVTAWDGIFIYIL